MSLILRASSALRRQICPASARMEKGLPDEDSDIAVEGTLLHSLDANPSLSRKNLTPNQRDLLDISSKLTIEALSAITDQFGVTDTPETIGGFEREMFLHRGIRVLFSGHCDQWKYFPEKKLLVVLERKFGFRSVDPATSNLQTRVYACMGAELHDCDNVAVAIGSPRLPAADRLTLAAYSRQDIKSSKEQLFQIWDACNTLDAPLQASDECRYCRARLNCPEFQKTIQSGLAIAPHPNGDLTKAARQTQVEERLSQCSDEQLGAMLEALQFAEFVKDIARNVARERIKAGGMPGYRLGKETEVRNIVDAQAAYASMVESGKIPPAKFFKHVEVSIGGMEEELRTAAIDGGGKMTWDKARDEVNSALGEAIERKARKPSIEKVKALPG